MSSGNRRYLRLDILWELSPSGGRHATVGEVAHARFHELQKLLYDANPSTLRSNFLQEIGHYQQRSDLHPTDAQMRDWERKEDYELVREAIRSLEKDLPRFAETITKCCIEDMSIGAVVPIGGRNKWRHQGPGWDHMKSYWGSQKNAWSNLKKGWDCVAAIVIRPRLVAVAQKRVPGSTSAEAIKWERERRAAA